jgi:predicted outer membrane repeat protein
MNGGAVSLDTNSSATFVEWQFIDNIAAGNAGAVEVYQAAANFSDCLFRGNSAGNLGGAITLSEDSLVVDRCLFTDNTAAHGGAIFSLASTAEITNSTLVGNHAASGGAATGAGFGALAFSHCTITVNSGAKQGGGVHISSEFLSIDSSPIAGNIAPKGPVCTYNNEKEAAWNNILGDSKDCGGLVESAASTDSIIETWQKVDITQTKMPMIVVIQEPAGKNCPNGGALIELGLDLNGNGFLDEIEVSDTDYVC